MLKLFKILKKSKTTSSFKIVKLNKESLNSICGGGDVTILAKEPRRTVGAGQVTEILK